MTSSGGQKPSRVPPLTDPSQATGGLRTSKPSQMQAPLLALASLSATNGGPGDSYRGGNPAEETSVGQRQSEWNYSYAQCLASTLSKASKSLATTKVSLKGGGPAAVATT